MANETQGTIKITEQQNVGHAKYVVNYYTGKKHQDGSDFYDIRIFTNKREKDKFVAMLRTQEQQLARWYAHVKATPSGHVPVLFGGIPAWNIAMNKTRIEQNFTLWPREHWPQWVSELLP
jgi:hypothetical protein